jgi:DNA polymerase-3 subunit alpha
LSPQQLVDTAARWGVEVLALTDVNNTSCALEFVKRCEKVNIKPLLGVEFREEGIFRYVGLAKNMEGWRELNEVLSNRSITGKPLPMNAPSLPNCWVIYPRLLKPIDQFRGNELLGIRPEHVNRLFSHELKHHQRKLVVLSPVTFMDEEGYELHCMLRAIDKNTLITKLTPRDTAKKNEYFIPPDTLKGFYRLCPTILQNTKKVIASCHIEVETGLQNNRLDFTGSKDGDYSLLEKLAVRGCKRRYGEKNRDALLRMQRELKVIKGQNFCAYFLIAWDVVKYAHSMGYHHVGRGSGANSIVAFCLNITDVDPMELGLYFERFINPHRTSPPDFDIDFSWDERDDVTDYIFKRYGREHVALLATYNTFKGRSILRELGKVYGLPKAEIDAMVADPVVAAKGNSIARKIFTLGKRMQGMPNYLSIHAGGVIISEKPLNYYTALQLMPKGFPIVHFDMYHAEDWGFHKFDILSQRGLGHIKDAIELVRMNQGLSVDVYDLESIKEDFQVKKQLKSGKCMGCFYIESPAMRGLLQKLHCDTYIHLVAVSSIIRPGVAKSGMMKEYIRRFHAPESFKYLHPVFEAHLGETFGVMVYQEDVMKIVHHFAGLELDESDVLRRIMSGKKYKGDTFERLKNKYYVNCGKRGYSKALAGEVWRQVESFSGYSFCKAHSASYAMESFQSLYLKAHYPMEFMVAVINNFGGFYRTEYYFHEARMAGADIHPPCVNNSNYLTTISGKDIYMGFIHLHSFERRMAHEIIHQRSFGGAFTSLKDFVDRVGISSEQFDILIRINAFRFTGKSKYELMWEKNAVFNAKTDFESSLNLFEEGVQKFDLPVLEEGPFDQAFDEIELLGFSLCSPFDLLLKDDYYDCVTSAYLKKYVGKIVWILGYYVCQKKVYTSNAKTMAFGTWIDRDGHFFDTTHFPDFLKRHPFRGKGIYFIKGKVVLEFGFPSIEVMSMQRLAFVEDERY